MREPCQRVIIELSIAIEVFDLDVSPALELSSRQPRQLRIGYSGMLLELPQGQSFLLTSGFKRFAKL